MRLSTRVRYGMQAMLALALRSGPEPMSIKEIAERQDLPEHYLEQLITPLRRAGLVQSARGAQGGYVLARPAREITLLEVVQALDGPLELESCECPPSSPHAQGFCLEHALWRRLKQQIDDFLEGETLDDLRAEAASAAALRAPVYDI